MKTIQIMLAAAAAMITAPAAAQDVNGTPNYGTINLDVGFEPDPQTIAVSAGGDLDASGIGNACRGYISNAPDLRLVYQAGSSLPLILSVSADADTTLVVNAPDGRFYCDDDGGNRGLNPSIRFDRPASGRYEIWVGTYRDGNLEKAELKISELYSE